MKKTLKILIPVCVLSILAIYLMNYSNKNIAATLIDNQTGDKFVLDKNRIIITAFDSFGKELWKTNPRIASHLGEYRHKDPIITYFEFDVDSTNGIKEVIGINYSNSQFGYIDKSNGNFHFEGQD